MEAAAALDVLDQGGGRREARTEALLVALQLGQHLVGTDRVEVPERTAAEGREPESEDGPDVAVTGAAQDAIPPAVQRLVDELQVAALADLVA